MSLAVAKPRILVVEDETLIVMFIEDVLEDLGYEVVGPAGKLEAAMTLARESPLDGAILDVTVRGGLAYPVADILRGRGVPFVLASGYGEWALPEAFRGLPRLVKPFTAGDLTTAIEKICPPAR